MMTQSEQSAFVRDGMEDLYRALEQMDPIFLKMCGVPEEMQAGPGAVRKTLEKEVNAHA